ncbi:MAG TPA: DUF1573 domain-containing protein [Candidatus Sulfotelmatobacter sp.]|nr:DUF1573 domain-containing protein [Candidatus Sulfotelmatobacter sp.]
MSVHRAKRVARFWRFFFWLLLSLPCLDGLAQPRLVIDQPVWNFGSVTNLVWLEHDFVISNAGDEPLKVSQVVSSCNSCLLTDIEKNTIPPRSSTLVRSRLDLRLLSGEITRAIMIDCNDPQQASIVLELRGEVVSAYLVTPSAIELDLSKEQTATAQIQPLFKLRADLSQVDCDDSNIVATIGPESSAGTTLTVESRQTILHGNTFASVTVHSDNSNDLPCRVTVLIHNPPEVEVVPAQLTFQPQADPQMQILWLKQHGSSPLTLLDAVPSSDDYQCEIDPEPDGVDYRIYVTALQQQLSTGKTNSLVLKMTDAQHQAESVVIPLFVEGQ